MPAVAISEHFGPKGKENSMRFLLPCAAIALLTLSACNAPKREPDDEDRTEQRGDNDDDD